MEQRLGTAPSPIRSSKNGNVFFVSFLVINNLNDDNKVITIV